MIHYSDHKIQNIKAISLRNLYIRHNVDLSNTNSTDKSFQINTPTKLSRKNSIIHQIPLIGDQQSHLELLSLNNHKLVDSFVSLHKFSQQDDLIYVSEVVKSDMNPNFEVVLPNFLDNNNQRLKIKVWVKRGLVSGKLKTYGNWKLHQELHIDLSKLTFIGTTLEDKEDFFTNNSVILDINGRLYTIDQFLKVKPEILIQDDDNKLDKPKVKSYKYDDIRSITSLATSFAELIKSKSKSEEGISDLIHLLDADKNHETIEYKSKRLKVQILILEKEITKLKSSNEIISKQVIAYKHRIEDLTHEISERIPSLNEACIKDIEVVRLQLGPIKEVLTQSIYPSIIETLNEHTKVIQQITLIDNIDNSIRFKIVGLEFPISKRELLDICYYNQHKLRNFNLDPKDIVIEDHDAKIQQVNTAILYIVNVIQELANITNTFLRYRIRLKGNMYTINDASEADGDGFAEYPLFYLHDQTEKVYNNQSGFDKKTTLKNEKFERGFTLLNKNLVYLISHVTGTFNTYNQGIKNSSVVANNTPVDCLDNLLWNLQYIMLFLTAPYEIQKKKI